LLGRDIPMRERSESMVIISLSDVYIIADCFLRF